MKITLAAGLLLCATAAQAQTSYFTSQFPNGNSLTTGSDGSSIYTSRFPNGSAMTTVTPGYQPPPLFAQPQQYIPRVQPWNPWPSTGDDPDE